MVILYIHSPQWVRVGVFFKGDGHLKSYRQVFSSMTIGDVWIIPSFFNLGIYSVHWAHFMCHHKLWPTSASNFYTPVWKTDVLCRGDVHLSVRPSFPEFSSTCYEISLWNLVYAFSRWHDMWSLSFITIGSLWPSLQPKVGQTQFLQLWPYKSR